MLRSGDYTTRMIVRKPKNMKNFSGDLVVEIINMSAGYDWTAIWSSLWQRVVRDGDIYVGLTSKPNVLPRMLQFDAERYADLDWSNPLPPEEHGLAYDMFTQTARLLKSNAKANPIGKAAPRVYLSGESQSGGYLMTYYRSFTPSAVNARNMPLYDGYLNEASSVRGSGAPLNQCATGLPAGDPRRKVPSRSVPLMAINSTWEYPGARDDGTTPADSNTRNRKFRAWEVAGANHGWKWQYLYGDANAEDLIAAGFTDPATYAWSCGPNNPEVPFQLPEKASWVALKRWVTHGEAPARAPRILTDSSAPGTDKTLFDGLNNPMGGLRMPMIEVPVASFGPGQYALTGDCPEIVPFAEQTLRSLHPSKAVYLKQYRNVTKYLVRQGFVLREDADDLMRVAKRVTSIPASGS